MNYPLLFSFLDALHPTSARRPTVQFEFSFEYEPFHALHKNRKTFISIIGRTSAGKQILLMFQGFGRCALLNPVLMVFEQAANHEI